MNVTIREFADTLAKVAGVQVRFEHPEDMEKRGYSTLNREILDSGKLQGLGYMPQTGLEEAFQKILEIKR